MAPSFSMSSSSSHQPILAMATTPNTQQQLSKYSPSIPFLRRPQHLTNEFAGDVGFDPLNLATSREQLLYYREAEVKHGRLAMLAAAGWPISELFDKSITQELDADFDLNLVPIVDESDRAPSVLNGGLDSISPLFWGLCLGLAAAIDLKGIQNTRYNDNEDSTYIIGDYNFDPLGLYPIDDEGKQRMQLAEIKHGRLAMIAITAFAVQEFVSKVGVVDETPIFFKPLF